VRGRGKEQEREVAARAKSKSGFSDRGRRGMGKNEGMKINGWKSGKWGGEAAEIS
jgi:hypothetical protein